MCKYYTCSWIEAKHSKNNNMCTRLHLGDEGGGGICPFDTIWPPPFGVKVNIVVRKAFPTFIRILPPLFS